MKTILISLLTIFLLACSSTPPAKVEEEAGKSKEKEAQNTTLVTLTEAQAKNANIETGKGEKRSVAAIMQVNGKIDVPPQNIVSISFPLGGYLKSTKLLPGMPIRKGEVLGVLEDPQYIQLQQDYLTATIKVKLLEKEYNRQKELNASQASSDKVFQQTESEYESQKVMVKALAEKLHLIGINTTDINAGNISRTVNIYSPINGFVSKVNVNIGKYVSPTDVLFELVNPTDIHLALSVFQKDVPALGIGQNVTAYTVNNPERKYPAKIILISRDIDANGSVAVHCHFEKYDKELIPGTFMNAEIETKNKQVFTLPEEAIVSASSKQYVFVVKDARTYEMKEIKTGEKENGYVEIIADNPAGLQNNSFVTKGAYTLLMKLKNTGDEE
jgi:cobalt-zinc-cadmium efflux system membrane fusion protein